MKKIKNSKMFMKLGTDHSSKTTIFKIAVVVIFLILALRMVYLQIFRYEKYKNMSEENRIKLKRIEPDRGKIYDKNGVILATNGLGYRLIYLKERKYLKEDLKRIAELTGFLPEAIEKRIKNGEISPYTRENILFENLEEKLAHKILEKIKPEDFVDIQFYSKRRYIYDSLGSHILGYVKKISSKEYETLKEEGYTARDSIGKDGIEKNYDKLLKGKSGFEKIEVNAYNRLQRKIDKQLPEPGTDVYLTIDYEIQNYMEKLLEEEKLTGSFIAMNPKNGEVLALVSYPTYSLNTFSSQISQEEWDAIRTDPRRPLSNKAIAGEYPPGSIFKPISAFAYLSKGVNPNQKYFDPGYYSIGSWTWKAWKVGGHGYVDMKKSIIESVNPYYYRFADQFGYKPILDFALMFGLNEKTGIDIPGEKKGVIPSPEWKKETFNTGWYKGDSVNMSIGQGYVTVTPIQMAQAYSFLANRGKIYQLHLINSTSENGEKKAIERKLVTEVELPSSYFDLMDDALRRTVSDGNGTTTILRTQGLEIGAKSGSAQNSQSKISHAWVAGYFPIKNPEIVFVALLEGAGGGGKIGGGVAKKFVDKYLEIKNREKEIENKEIE
ncbi:MAG: penicillin-binding protein 2 [Fusobacteriaceae bacterium]